MKPGDMAEIAMWLDGRETPAQRIDDPFAKLVGVDPRRGDNRRSDAYGHVTGRDDVERLSKRQARCNAPVDLGQQLGRLLTRRLVTRFVGTDDQQESRAGNTARRVRRQLQGAGHPKVGKGQRGRFEIGGGDHRSRVFDSPPREPP